MSHPEQDYSIFPAGQHSEDWDAPMISPSREILSWIVRALADDVATWEAVRDDDHDLRLGFLMYLADHLAPDERPDIALPPPALKVG